MAMLKRSPRQYATTNDWPIMSQSEKIENLHQRLIPVEEVNDVIMKTHKYVKWLLPIVITAALSSGLASGRFGAFLHALFTGVNNGMGGG